MAQASANYLSGARGAAVLNGSSSTAAPVINVTTGPVVEFDGKRYVSMDDLERAMRATAEGVIGTYLGGGAAAIVELNSKPPCDKSLNTAMEFSSTCVAMKAVGLA